MIRRDPIQEGVGAAGILADISANRTGLLAGGIRDILQTVRGNRLAEVQIHHAWLDHGSQILQIHLTNMVHLREDHEDATLERNRAAAEARSSATGSTRHLLSDA